LKQPSALPIIIGLVLLANILWYRMKVLLRRNGYEVSWLFRHWRDIPNFARLIGQTEDSRVRRNYRIIFISLLFTCLALVLLVLSGGLRAT
jgi:hypothetical protein